MLSNPLRPAQRTGAGLARQHDAIEHQRLVLVPERPAVQGRHRSRAQLPPCRCVNR